MIGYQEESDISRNQNLRRHMSRSYKRGLSRSCQALVKCVNKQISLGLTKMQEETENLFEYIFFILKLYIKLYLA
jgi:hypothetical protein